VRWGRRRSLLVDALMGAVSGLGAGWVMEKAQARIQGLGGERSKQREKEAQQRAGEPATVKAVGAAAGRLGIHLEESRKRRVGAVVHYVYGAAWGAVFGIAERKLEFPLLLAGVSFGAALWLVSDEILIPLFGFSLKPTNYPPSVHAKALAAHVVYGAATDGGYRLLSRVVS
jgi:putative membrane protein